MSAARPWMKFYPRDWRADEKLRMCSLAGRGLWMEMLALMHGSERYGHLLITGKAPTDAQLAILAGAPASEVAALLSELEQAGVFSRSATGAIYSRRMTDDERKARLARKHGNDGGNPKLKGGYNKPGFIYLIGVRSDGAYKIGCSVNPTNRLAKIKAQYRGQDLRVIDSWRVADMGAAEAECHSLFANRAGGEWFFLTASCIGKLSEKCSTLKGGEMGYAKGSQKARDQKPERKSKANALTKSFLQAGWTPAPFGEGSKSKAVFDGWDRGERERQLEAFMAHHIGQKTQWVDWQQAWSTWTLNSVKFDRSRERQPENFADHYEREMQHRVAAR